MSVITLAVFCVVNRLTRITHYMLGFLIVLNGCGNDMEAPLGYADNTSHGAGGKPVIDLFGIIGARHSNQPMCTHLLEVRSLSPPELF